MNGVKNRIRRLRRFRNAALCVGIVLGGCAAIYACNVPVFRYALERWYPDPYRATLFHRGPLTDSQKTLLRSWDDTVDGPSSNLVVEAVDVDAIEDEARRVLFAEQASPKLPLLVLQYPKSARYENAVWAEPFVDDALTRLTTSPARVELIKRLAAGHTAVWLMLESGNVDKDEAVARQLTEEIKNLSRQLTLPELTSAPEDGLLSKTPLKVEFSLLRVSRDVAAEKPLVELLLHSEPDLVDFDEPMVFPVFGRGRALLPLIGAGITADNILDSASFLVGACSCEIKELNPGFDLLLAADWDELLFHGASPAEIAAARLVAAQAVASSGKPELIAIPAGAPPAVANPPSDLQPEAEPPIYRQPLPVAFALLVVLVVIFAFKRMA